MLKRYNHSEDSGLHNILETADSRQAEIEISPCLLASQKDDLTQPLLPNEEMTSLDSSSSINLKGNTPNQDWHTHAYIIFDHPW